MWKSVVAISVGASLGALLRWQLGAKLNALWIPVPLGTLIANLLGGYVVGVAIGYFSQAAALAPEWRLLIVTGFCGALTTFSAFSVELMGLLQAGRLAWAAGSIFLHVAGTLLMTLAGMASWQFLSSGAQ